MRTVLSLSVIIMMTMTNTTHHTGPAIMGAISVDSMIHGTAMTTTIHGIQAPDSL